jgi:small-conductance mechanosensitive channel
MPPEPTPINLIRVFDFYVTVMFLISLLRRWDVYLDAFKLLIGVRGRWPKLMGRLREHQSLLLNWSFFRPAILALLLTVAQLVVSRVIYPQAVVTFAILDAWWWYAAIFLTMIPMVAVDLYFLIYVAKFDRDAAEKQLDDAEGWLGRKGRMVRIFTFGIVNPKRIVDSELQKGLESARASLNRSLWWVSLQIVLRMSFGLTLWTVWFVHR